MPLIKLKNDGTVYIIVRVTGLVDWSYEYYDQEKIYKGNNKDSNDGTTGSHAIGLPLELDHHANNWGIMIANVSDKEQEFAVELVWMQKNETVFKWEPKNAGEMKIKPGEVKSFGDASILVVQ
jgi:hypothetical protein